MVFYAAIILEKVTLCIAMADIRSFFASTARPSASSSSPTESSSVSNASMGEGEGMPPAAKFIELK